MSYRYDREKKRRNNWYLVGTLLIIVIIFTPVPRLLFDVLERPLERAWQESQENGEEARGLFNRFYAKTKLLEKQEELQREVDQLTIDGLRTAYLESVLSTYQSIREVAEAAIVADVVLTPPVSTAGTLVVNRGSNDGVRSGSEVITKENLSLGTVSHVYDTTSRVTLHTKAGQQTRAILYPHGESFTLIGHGDSYRAELERDSEVAEGDVAYSQFIPGRIVAVVQKIVFDPRDPYKEVYLARPLNLNTIQSVGIIPASTVLIPAETKQADTEEPAL